MGVHTEIQTPSTTRHWEAGLAAVLGVVQQATMDSTPHGDSLQLPHFSYQC